MSKRQREATRNEETWRSVVSIHEMDRKFLRSGPGSYAGQGSLAHKEAFARANVSSPAFFFHRGRATQEQGPRKALVHRLLLPAAHAPPSILSPLFFHRGVYLCEICDACCLSLLGQGPPAPGCLSCCTSEKHLGWGQDRGACITEWGLGSLKSQLLFLHWLFHATKLFFFNNCLIIPLVL